MVFVEFSKLLHDFPFLLLLAYNTCSVTETVFYLEHFDLEIIKGITFIYGGLSSDIRPEI